MAGTIAITPASGAITAKATVCRIDVTDAPDRKGTLKEGLPWAYKLVASKAGSDSLVSVVFDTSQENKWTWDNLIFPATGTWVINLVDTTDDSSEANLSVVVV